MSNDLIVVRGGAIMAYPPEFDLMDRSRSLGRDLEDVENPHPDVGRPRSFHSLAHREAGRLLQRMAPYCAPAGEAAVRAWVTPVLMATAAARDLAPEYAQARIAGCVMACSELAAGAFTKEAQKDLLRTATFNPVPSEFYAALMPRSVELRTRQEALRYILSQAVDDDPLGDKTPKLKVALRPEAEPLPNMTPEELRAEAERQIRELGLDPDDYPPRAA